MAYIETIYEMTSSDRVRKLIQKHPGRPSLWYARHLHAKEPLLFSTIEQARTMVRYVRGNQGKLARKYAKDKSQFRPNQLAGFIQKDSRVTKWTALQISAPGNYLVLSDVHVPYHDPGALRVMWEHTKDDPSISAVILNGDIGDFYRISRWQPDPRERNFPEELQMIREFLQFIRGTWPKARIIYKFGNHEERWENFLRARAPEVLGCEDFELKKLLRLSDYKIEPVEHKRPIKLGRLLTLIHGHEYNFQITNPVNPARGLFLRGKSHILAGHFHQTSQHSERTINQNVIGAWSTGSLCDLHPEYRPLNNWNHGFAIVEISDTGGFTVYNKVIIDGKVL